MINVNFLIFFFFKKLVGNVVVIMLYNFLSYLLSWGFSTKLNLEDFNHAFPMLHELGSVLFKNSLFGDGLPNIYRFSSTANNLLEMLNLGSKTFIWMEQVVDAHADEVWFLQFSHNGNYLSSSSKDKSAKIWEVRSSFTFPLLRLISHRFGEKEYSGWWLPWWSLQR